jgi:hypothetical protein
LTQMATWLSPALTPPPAEEPHTLQEPHTQQVLRMQGWVKAGGLALCSARAIWVWYVFGKVKEYVPQD